VVAKPAVPLAGRTVVERVLLWLAGQGVTDTVVNLHHLPETITAIAGDGAHLGLRVRYSWESPVLGSAGGPRHALPLLDADVFFIVNGDTLCDVDLPSLLSAHVASGADVTLAVAPNPAPDRHNGLRVDEADRVTGVAPAGAGESSWHFVGVQIARARVFAGLADGVPAESVHGIYQPLMHGAGGAGIHAHRVAASFMDVGTPADYLSAALSLGGGSAIEPGARIAPDARVERSIVWAGADVGPGARLEGCIVTDVDVPAGFDARDAILVPAAIATSADTATHPGPLALFPLR
jgi:NDP-sugar pyrophosphorylase family protein